MFPPMFYILKIGYPCVHDPYVSSHHSVVREEVPLLGN